MSEKYESSLTEEVLDSISDAFVSIDHDFNVTHINKAAEKFSGRIKKDVVGKNVLEAFPMGKNTILLEKYLKLFNEKKSFEFELILMYFHLRIGIMYVYFHLKEDLIYYFEI